KPTNENYFRERLLQAVFYPMGGDQWPLTTIISVVTLCAISLSTGLHASQITSSTTFNQTAKPKKRQFFWIGIDSSTGEESQTTKSFAPILDNAYYKPPFAR